MATLRFPGTSFRHRVPRFPGHFGPGFWTATIKFRYLRSLGLGVRYPQSGLGGICQLARL